MHRTSDSHFGTEQSGQSSCSTGSVWKQAPRSKQACMRVCTCAHTCIHYVCICASHCPGAQRWGSSSWAEEAFKLTFQTPSAVACSRVRVQVHVRGRAVIKSSWLDHGETWQIWEATNQRLWKLWGGFKVLKHTWGNGTSGAESRVW